MTFGLEGGYRSNRVIRLSRLGSPGNDGQVVGGHLCQNLSVDGLEFGANLRVAGLEFGAQGLLRVFEAGIVDEESDKDRRYGCGKPEYERDILGFAHDFRSFSILSGDRKSTRLNSSHLGIS